MNVCLASSPTHCSSLESDVTIVRLIGSNAAIERGVIHLRSGWRISSLQQMVNYMSI